MMTEVSSDDSKPRQSSKSKAGKNFEEALKLSRQSSKEKVANVKQYTADDSFSSISGRWGNAIEGSKEFQNKKMLAVKRNSINVTAGFVSSRVNLFEQCVMQKQASAEQIESMLRLLFSPSSSKKPPKISISSCSDSNDREHVNPSETEENTPVAPLQFMCNDTNSYYFESSSSTYLQLNELLAENSDKPVALRCGVFMTSDTAKQQEASPRAVIALAMRDPRSNEPYIALTINSSSGDDFSHTAGSTGVALRVALFLPSDTENSLDVAGELDAVWEAVFDLTRGETDRQGGGKSNVECTLDDMDGGGGNITMEGRNDHDDQVDASDGGENFDGDSTVDCDRGEECVESSANHSSAKTSVEVQHDPKEDSVNDVSFGDSEASFGRGRGGFVSDSDSAVDEGEGVWSDAFMSSDVDNVPNQEANDSYCYDTDVSSVTSSMPNTPINNVKTSVAHIFSLEGGLPEIRNNISRSDSVSDIERRHYAKIALERATSGSSIASTTMNNVITMESEPMILHDSDLEVDRRVDRSGVISFATIDTDVNAFDIILASASRKMLIIKNRVDNCSTVISTATGTDVMTTEEQRDRVEKCVVDAASNIAIAGDTLVQWTRAVAMSGWLTKWPMQNQKVSCVLRRAQDH